MTDRQNREINIHDYYIGAKQLPSQSSHPRLDVLDFLMDFRRDNEELLGLVESEGSWIEGGTSPDKRFLLSSLILSFNVQVFVEIGLNSGIMAAAASRALNITGGRYIGFELRSELKFVTDHLCTKYGYSIEMFWGDSAQTIPRFIADGNKEIAGLVFIDGDHSPEGLRANIVNSLSLVKRGGIIVIDDSKDESLSQEIKAKLNHLLWIPGLHPQDTGLCIYQK